ncbi:MAG: MG2 domain-containing protein, partial [Cyclobacteriaceae bacterium]
MVNRYKTALPKLILGTILLIATVGFISIDERFIIELSDRLSKFNDARPSEKIYLQLDKEVYQPGDDIWFKGYILDAISFRPIERSKTLFVSVLDDEGSLVSEDKFIIRNGYSAGDLTLPEVMDDGNYQITAYTSWMKNYDDPQIFSRYVQVKKLAPVEMIMPKVTLDLAFSDSIYYPGQEVAIKVLTSTTAPSDTKELQYEFSIKADGEEVQTGSGYGLNNGSFYIRYTLPENQEASSYTAEISSLYEDQTIAVDAVIPVDVPSLNVDFFPEGGKIIKAVSSRVAFRATDKFGNPVAISGRIESSSGQKVANVSTRHRGMGDFNFFPNDSLYYLVVTSPEIKENKFPIRNIAQGGLGLSVVGQ